MRPHLSKRPVLLLLFFIMLPLVVFAADVRHGKTGKHKPGSVFRDCSDCPEMVVIPKGGFTMGSPSAEAGRSDDEGPLHQVKSKRAFAMSKTEVTQAQWAALMGNNPSNFSNCGSDCPVEKVSWNDAHEYLSRLNAKTGKHYRLPSEAEWEYACRAGGEQTTYCGSENVDSGAWYYANSNKTTHPVAGKQANAWGLHDMSGNVFEWVEDCWNANYEGAPTDGSAWTSGDCSLRVLRGGSWFSEPALTRSAKRLRLPADDRNGIAGFRIVISLP